MNVGIGFPVNTVQYIQNSLWLLGGGCIVEINKLMAMNLLVEDRKLVADIRQVQHKVLYQYASTKVK